MKIALIGDAHGETTYMRVALRRARELGADLAIQVGDYGYWPDAHRYTATIRREAAKLDLTMWVIPGNHDYPGQGRKTDAGYLAWQTDTPQLDQHCVVARGTVVTIDGTRVGFMGGAISIDRARRTLGRNYWNEERINDADVERALDNGPVDLWITHDAVGVPSVLPEYHWPDVHLHHDLTVATARMRTMFEALRPSLHVHGHYHVAYSAPTEYGVVVGLSCEHLPTSCIVVDTSDLTTWSWFTEKGT